jgi:hypothetical protein
LNQSALDRSSLEFKKHATSSHRRHCLFRQIHFQIVALESAVHVTNKLVVVIASLPPELLNPSGLAAIVQSPETLADTAMLLVAVAAKVTFPIPDTMTAHAVNRMVRKIVFIVSFPR